MSTTETLPTTYLGFFIDKVTDPWEIKFGNKVVFSKGDRIDYDPGFAHHASDLEEAKELIDEIIYHESIKK